MSAFQHNLEDNPDGRQGVVEAVRTVRADTFFVVGIPDGVKLKDLTAWDLEGRSALHVVGEKVEINSDFTV